MHSESSTPPARPWWRFGHVWLLISGPAVVVVAGFFTFYLAVTRPDPVLTGNESQQSGSVQAADDISQAPALQARNHAATGVLPKPPEASHKP